MMRGRGLPLMATNWCGIYYYVTRDEIPQDKKWMPLISLSARATICQSSSRLTLKQAFTNTEREAIDEAAYSFPIYEGAAIVEFTCRIGDRVLQGVIRDKHQARKVYETAKEQGQRAALVVQNTPDVWSTKVSNIPPGAKVEVEITVVCELKHDAQVDGIRFVLPTNIAPRYGAAPANLPSDISPESKGIEMTVAVTMASPITSLQSPSHPIEVGMGTHTPNRSLSKEEFNICKGFATLSQSDTALDKDFVLIVVSGDIGKPQAIMETHSSLPNSKALLLSLVPKFQMPRIKPEIIFIADRSGSMQRSIPQLRNALKVFLKSLPVGVKFNICSFGSRYSFLWPKSMPYDQDNLNTALKHVETFAADYGGTEMFPPVEEALKIRYKDMETEIILLTDGEIWETKRLFDLVKAECDSGNVRVFSVGIGNSVSHLLLEGVARAGRGYAQIVGAEDKLDAKLVRMLKAALGAHVKGYELLYPHSTVKTKDSEEDFEMVDHEESSALAQEQSTEEKTKQTISLYDTSVGSTGNVESKPHSGDRFSHLPPFQPPSSIQTPYSIPPLYPFSRTNVYILFSGSEAIPPSVTVRGTTTSGANLELEVPITDVGKGSTIHQLAARKLLQELEEGGSYLHSGKFGIDPKDEGKFMDWIEREATRVGTTFGVAGKCTSFVAVENVEELEKEIKQQAEPVIHSQADAGSRFLSVKNAEVRARRMSRRKSSAPMMHMLVASPGQPPSFSQSCSAPVPPDGLVLNAARFIRGGSAPVLTAAVEPRFGGSAGVISSGDSVPSIQAWSSIAQSQSLQYTCGSVKKGDREKVRSEKVALSGSNQVAGKQRSLRKASFAPRANLFAFLPQASPTDKSMDDDDESETYALLGKQAFDGSFPSGSGDWATELTQTFRNWIQEDHADGVASLKALGKEDLEKVLASAVAIAVFEGELKDSQDVWEMVVEKADGWGVENVGETAWNAVKRWVSQQMMTADDSKRRSFW